MRTDLQPKVPSNLPPLGGELLELLRGQAAGRSFVLGGGVVLNHYHEFRPTHDLDAWWLAEADETAWAAARSAMQELARRHGLVFSERQWNETRSAELRAGNRKAFSFQVSIRDIMLDPPADSAWQPVLIESFRDNLGAKMNALVGRGAPRDITDVFVVCDAGLATVTDCWELWQRKNPGGDPDAARRNVLHHLASLEARRPLETFQSPVERARAALVRGFIRHQFCQPPPP